MLCVIMEGKLEITERDAKTEKLTGSKSMLGPVLMIAGIFVPFMLPVVGALIDALFKIPGFPVTDLGTLIGALAAVLLQSLAIAKAGKKRRIIRIAAIALLVLSSLWLLLVSLLATIFHDIGD